MPRSPRDGSGRKKTPKKPIESYEHKDKQRANNPPVGLVTPETDRNAGTFVASFDGSFLRTGQLTFTTQDYGI